MSTTSQTTQSTVTTPLSTPSVESTTTTTPATSPTSTGADAMRKRPTEEPLTKCGRKNHKLSKYIFMGHHFGRMQATWTSPYKVMSFGLEYEMAQYADKVQEYSTEEKRALCNWQAAFATRPSICNEIIDATDNEFRIIADSLRQGQCAARSDDTATLKPLVVTWINYPINVLAASPTRKHQRGFNNDTIACLLAPVDAFPLTEEYIDQLKASTATITDDNGLDRLVNGTDFMEYMYAGGVYDLQNLLHGFLKGELLVKVYKAIFLSPSSADMDDFNTKATRQGNAKLHNMTRVTHGSIAYITTQVYFALSSKSTFSPMTTPEVEQIYDTVYSFFESDVPQIKDYGVDLLNWWNRVIFPGSAQALNRRAMGSLARLEARFSALEIEA